MLGVVVRYLTPLYPLLQVIMFWAAGAALTYGMLWIR
jgi:hypothetical protein